MAALGHRRAVAIRIKFAPCARPSDSAVCAVDPRNDCQPLYIGYPGHLRRKSTLAGARLCRVFLSTRPPREDRVLLPRRGVVTACLRTIDTHA